MTICRYSLLHKAITEEEKKQLPHMLKLFQDRAEKRKSKGDYVQFDPDVVTVDIQRWQYAKRRNEPGIKPIEQYKTHEELHAAMEGFLSEEEIKLQEEQETSSGTVELFKLPGGYVVYEVSTPQALSKLSQGSHWCVQNVSTAKTYLDARGNFQVIHKQGQPLVAITIEEVWYFTDYELRDGKNYSPQQSTPYVLKQDFDAINKTLQKLQKPQIEVSSRKREDLVIINNYNEIQERVDKALLKGDSEELKRALLNLRDFPINIPAGTVIKGDLNLSKTNIRKLPSGLSVGGSLYLQGTPITSLPEGLSVGWYLDLSGTKITSLPEGLSVGGSLYLQETPITSLPEGLSVGGSLDLQETPITSLPEGLSVGGYLDLRGTPITSLPEGLSVGGSLYLSGTKITSLPEGLSVGGNLYLRGTPITSLPSGLSVGGDLYLQETPITSLPEGLSVGRGLYLYGTKITSLPEGLSVGGSLSGENPETGKSWQEEYDEIVERRSKTSSLRKLRIVK